MADSVSAVDVDANNAEAADAPASDRSEQSRPAEGEALHAAAGHLNTNAKPRVLCLSPADGPSNSLVERLGGDVEVVTEPSSLRAWTLLLNEPFDCVYADAAQFAEAARAGQLLQNERILGGLPDGVLLLGKGNKVMWGNGRLSEWTGHADIVGKNFYELLGGPDILGPDYCPFHTALSSEKASASTIRCSDGRYFRVHAAPVIEAGTPPEHLCVTLREVTDEMLQQQKLAAIHQAGVELADLTTDEVANMDVKARIELLKANILDCTQDVLQFDVVEIRMLNHDTNELQPLLALGMKQEAEERVLRAELMGNGVTGSVAASGQSYLCDDTSNDPLYLEGAQDARSSLTVPLVLHDQVIGTFNVESPESRAFTESDLQFLEIFARDVAVAVNTLELLAAEKATTAAASVEAIHSAVAMPVDDILNEAVNIMERYIGHDPDVAERVHRILRNARDIKQVIQKIGQSLAPIDARPQCVRVEPRQAVANKHVLVADADESVRSAAHDLLERYHCVVETAHDAREAISMIKSRPHENQYDAIIADIRLPDMSGHQLLLHLKELMDPVPLILMTGFGYDPGHSIVKARQAGLRAVLYKPFRLDQLLETVEKMVTSEPLPAGEPVDDVTPVDED